jgi:hypothetical protein
VAVTRGYDGPMGAANDDRRPGKFDWSLLWAAPVSAVLWFGWRWALVSRWFR